MYTIELANVVNGAHIRYTTNGVRPDVHSMVYTEPVKVKRLQDFQAITVVNSRQYSLPLYFPVNYPKLKEYGKLIKELRPWDMSSDKTDYVEINATGKINKNRKYTVSFWLTDGDGTIEIESVGLYKNGKLIDEDTHIGLAGAKSEDNL
jgi:hexosaminidase